ncbi:MAG: MarR family transcriptional regulator [Dehalococcoidales bacterium]|nr:MarR family transcriptional regulator [Dehalococcoidales bacterium]
MINIELENPVYNAFMLFMQTANAVQKLSDSTLYKKCGLSTSKYAVLQILEVSNGTMTPSEIARWILRERHNVTTLVSRMKREGLVEVEPSTTDRRSVNIILTEKGRKKLQEAKPVAQSIVEKVMGPMSERNTNSLMKLLAIIRKSSHEGMSELFNSPTKWGV